MNMNKGTLPIATFVAAIAAFALLPISAAAAGTAVTVTGVISILAADYGRSERRAPADVLPFTRAERLERRDAA
jgi:hypothetical protein